MPEPKLTLAAWSSEHNDASSIEGHLMGRDTLLLDMLEALVRSWLETMTPIEIGADLERVKLMKAARVGLGELRPSPLVIDVYREVFLKDVWSNGGIDEGRAA